jgi:hypothetical protein
MGIFSKGRSDAAPGAVAEAPHPALASLETFRDAPLADAAAAVLVLGFSGAEPGDQLPGSQLTLRAQELFGPVTGLKGTKLLMHFQDRQLELVLRESLGALSRSLLVDISHMGASQSPNVALTRRGRRALASGAVERWMDVPADPARA